MGLIRDDRQGGLNKTKLRLPVSKPTARNAQPNSAGAHFLAAVGPSKAFDRPAMMRPEDTRALKTHSKSLRALGTDFARQMTPYGFVEQLYLDVRHPKAYAKGLLHGPPPGSISAGTVVGPNSNPLLDAAATEFHFAAKSGAQPDHVAIATKYGLAPQQLLEHVGAWDNSINEMLSNKAPEQLAKESGRYKSNALRALAERAAMAEWRADSAKRNAWRDARDMKLMKSEVLPYKEVNPAGVPPELQVGTVRDELAAAAADLGVEMPGIGPKTNPVMAHGTKQLFDQFSDRQADREGNLYQGTHFFTDNYKVAGGYSGRHLPEAEPFSQTFGSISDFLAARKAAANDPKTSYGRGLRSNLLDELARREKPLLPGAKPRFVVRPLMDRDIKLNPGLDGFRGSKEPVYVLEDTRDGRITGTAWNKTFLDDRAMKDNEYDKRVRADMRPDRYDLQQVANHKKMKKWLKQQRKSAWENGDAAAKKLYEDMHQLTFDNQAQRNIQEARAVVQLGRPDPLAMDQRRYVGGGSSINQIPNTKLAQLDIRDSLHLDDEVGPATKARLLRAYGELVARQSGQKIAVNNKTGELEYGLPYDDPRVTAPLRDAGRAWLRNRRETMHGLTSDNAETLFSTFGHDLGYKNVWKVRKRAGFGGMMHKGGIRVGNEMHNVAIVDQAKQIRDPWVNPHELLAKHKEAGVKVADELVGIVKQAQELGVDMSGFLPKAGPPNKSLWDRIYEGRGKDIEKLQLEIENSIDTARENAKWLEADLGVMHERTKRLVSGRPQPKGYLSEAAADAHHSVQHFTASTAELTRLQKRLRKLKRAQANM
jgi:hypothetical protein